MNERTAHTELAESVTAAERENQMMRSFGIEDAEPDEETTLAAYMLISIALLGVAGWIGLLIWGVL